MNCKIRETLIFIESRGENMNDRQNFLETRLKEAEEKIRAQSRIIRNLELYKEQFDSIMENMSEFVERSDPNFYLTYANKSLAEFYGMTQEEMLHTDTMALVVPEDPRVLR